MNNNIFFAKCIMPIHNHKKHFSLKNLVIEEVSQKPETRADDCTFLALAPGCLN